MLLQRHERIKLDETEDSLFYSFPRFVTHVDQGFIDKLTTLYQKHLKPQTRILDLMSSWVSHLPPEIQFSYVEGHGMNEEELTKNSQLDHYFIQDLNQNLKLPLSDQDFDAVLICVSIQYLQYPEAILSEIHRILKPGGITIISFSNRMFYQKAISAWREAIETDRIELVKSYINSVKINNLPGFNSPKVIASQSKTPLFMQMLGMGGSDPFYALIASRKS
ncbi:class I SAM-dependent methyltransferase [Planktothrix agardhii]|jgi:SAM-dependent methyltransferase|uniref:Methyltransferase type 11 n=2 Tax=Planktothrix agardhii TaxID=1160 RepID=A0A073CTC5_PLAA1|nr:methyltransferase domain-containing protein [Planktothrix agardhii]MCF3606896.1 class I SAM-dependent methyltransferase [Planktothrix agardhii 1033]KEI67270.1 Methyltransferase type 11 [Planktothrix agardhii NIVA-CYA 126/8]MBG0747774.1 class I SAM-dependent methyltransferase [Planktothrix agardhii KL2]MCB8759916.1 class I SAM-dependent methyltransferase [Planktothrix agardhii 1813]MCB8764328.1 class I SAM-dependent methyltransferase [Planktothrix agardhii 1809]